MLAMDEEKLPPPRPAHAAQVKSTQSWVLWTWCTSQPLGTTMASSMVGMKSNPALTVVQALPPNLGTANVYGIRNIEPIRLGIRVNKNSSETDRMIPILARLRTTIV